MDKGTDARKMLMGEEIQLKLGYVGVRNRSQQDINDKVKVKKSIDEEREYFSKHPVYCTMNPQVKLKTIEYYFKKMNFE